MWLLDFFQGFIDLFRSRYVRYLESEIVRLRQENAGLNSTLLSSKGITVVPSPDMQDLSARGNKLRTKSMPERSMRPVTKRSTVAGWRQKLEHESRKEAAEIENEIRQQRENQDAVNASL
jgi:hypothetical protein